MEMYKWKWMVLGALGCMTYVYFGKKLVNDIFYIVCYEKCFYQKLLKNLEKRNFNYCPPQCLLCIIMDRGRDLPVKHNVSDKGRDIIFYRGTVGIWLSIRN